MAVVSHGLEPDCFGYVHDHSNSFYELFCLNVTCFFLNKGSLIEVYISGLTCLK